MKLEGKVAIVTGGARDLGQCNISEIGQQKVQKFA